MADFVKAAGETYRLDGPPIAVGFSNGANIAAATLLLRPGILRGALLLRPMVPLIPDELPSLDGVPVAILAGRADPIVSPEQSSSLAELLKGAGAEVEFEWIAGPTGSPAKTSRSGEAGWRGSPADGRATLSPRCFRSFFSTASHRSLQC